MIAGEYYTGLWNRHDDWALLHDGARATDTAEGPRRRCWRNKSYVAGVLRVRAIRPGRVPFMIMGGAS